MLEVFPEQGNRHGDNASYNIDENGNGFIFFLVIMQLLIF